MKIVIATIVIATLAGLGYWRAVFATSVASPPDSQDIGGGRGKIYGIL
jgi:hypothetical protein